MDFSRREEVRDVARQVLKTHRITDPPVPVRTIAEAEGLTIAPMRWGRGHTLDALLVRNERLLAVNLDKPVRRQTFSIAHELGHYFLNHDEARLYGGSIDIDHPPVADPANQLEKEADEFGGELLMPRAFLERYAPKRVEAVDSEEFSFRPFEILARARLAKPLTVRQLADLFNVSREAICVALGKYDLL